MLTLKTQEAVKCCDLNSSYLIVGISGSVYIKNDVADFGDLRRVGVVLYCLDRRRKWIYLH